MIEKLVYSHEVMFVDVRLILLQYIEYCDQDKTESNNRDGHTWTHTHTHMTESNNHDGHTWVLTQD